MAQAIMCLGGCGTPIIQQPGARGRPRSWCDSCKNRRPVTVTLPTRHNADATAEEKLLTVEGTTRALLQEHDRVASPHGQAALVLARALDAGRGGGVGIAAVAKQHADSLEAALSGAKGEPDALDALMGRLG